MESYIGVTGFMSADEVNTLLTVFPKNGNHLLMIGVLASWKTMRNIRNKYPNRYPDMHDIGKIFPNSDQALNLIHYNTDDPSTLDQQLTILEHSWGGENLHGFQLNIAWPNPDIVEKYVGGHVERHGRLPYMVLQIGSHAFEMVDCSPKRLAEKIEKYDVLIDTVLLDPSGGHGKLLDIEMMKRYLDALSGKDVNIGIAGGLSQNTLDHIAPLVRDFPKISIDAEGRLRDKDDHLDLKATEAYLQKALQLLG